jgi:hypothetical protein
MKILQKLSAWISKRLEYVDELPPEREEERRTYVERRKTCVGYDGPERRSGTDRRTKINME